MAWSPILAILRILLLCAIVIMSYYYYYHSVNIMPQLEEVVWYHDWFDKGAHIYNSLQVASTSTLTSCTVYR